MSKSEKMKLNWNNQTLVNVGNYLHYSEGRLDKEELIKQGTKTLFYQLKKSGYIKEVENSRNMFKATEKFKRQYRSNVNSGATWGGAGSSNHASGMAQIVKLLPERVVRDHSIKTEEALKEELRDFKETEIFKNRVEEQKDNYTFFRDKAARDYDEKIISRAEYELKLERARFLENVLADDKGVSVVDMETVLHKEEVAVLREKLEEMSQLANSEREKGYWIRAVNVLKLVESTVDVTTISIGIEVVTSNYSDADIQAKMNYATLCDKIIILVPAAA